MNKFFPKVRLFQQACPMWVPLIENNEYASPGGKFFIRKYADELLSKCETIDSIILACTHYPLILEELRRVVPSNVQLISQGPIVSERLVDYLRRHPEIDDRLIKNGSSAYYTTDSTLEFEKHASSFLGKTVEAKHLELE